MSIPMVNFSYKILFVSGTLNGLTSVQNLKYPLSSMERELTRIQEDIASKRKMGSTRSRYIITELISVMNLGD